MGQDQVKNNLKRIIGLQITDLHQIQYYFNDEEYDKGMGLLEISFENGNVLNFGCGANGQNLNVKLGNATYEDDLDFQDGNKYECRKIKITEGFKRLIGIDISGVEVEVLSSNKEHPIIGCKIIASNDDYLYITTDMSDELFWGQNKEPLYHLDEKFGLRFEQIDKNA